MGDASCGLDDVGEGAEGGAGRLEDEDGGEGERGGRDQELDEQQVPDRVVDARVAGAEEDLRSVGQGLVKDEQRSVCPDRRAGLGRRGRRSSGAAEADGDPLEREAG